MVLADKMSKDRNFIPVYEGTTSDGQHTPLHESGIDPGGVVHEADRYSGDELFLVRQGTFIVIYSEARLVTHHR
jgi:hypothetical protein